MAYEDTIAYRKLTGTDAQAPAPEASAAAADAFLENGSGDGESATVACRRCGRVNPARRNKCGPCGAWLLRNAGAVKDGIYRQQQPADIRLTSQELVDGIVSDLGGFNALTTVERAYVGHLSDVSVILRLLVNDAVVNGLFTPGRNPRPVVDKILAAVDRFDRLAQRLGTTRRARQVLGADTFDAALAREPEAR